MKRSLVLCIGAKLIDIEVEKYVKVRFLTFLNALLTEKKEGRMLFVEAEGFSNDASLGVPALMPAGDKIEVTDGLAVFDFVIIPAGEGYQDKLDWIVKTVFDVSSVNLPIKGVKVRAEENADIVLIFSS